MSTQLELNPHFHQQQPHNQQKQKQKQKQPQQQQHQLQLDPHFSQHGLKGPKARPTNPIAWFTAIFCIILWVMVILGGLAVLIVYLIFRPRSPQFDIPSATLNAAYLDTGSLLNADLTVLTNFTNPNKKVSVDFSHVVIDLYYENTLIASSSVEPFSAIGSESRLLGLHMVTSQVLIKEKEIETLKNQVQRNNITFEVKGSFRTRSNIGSLFHYSYWLYGRCSIALTGPPTGILVSRDCRTKR